MPQTTYEDKYQGCYGMRVSPSKAKAWVKRNIESNIARQRSGLPRCTLNVWGLPGTSKTSIIKQLSSEKILFNGEEKNIKVVDIPLAQIEEMGDVLGFPVEEVEVLLEVVEPSSRESVQSRTWIKAVDSIIGQYLKDGWSLTGNKRTTYAPPDWVPVESCPGVILFDDGNRASQRIMKGLMQLIQDYRTISWSIPAGWTICFTGNPDNRHNQVTSMDTAQLTRMKHITLEYNAREWATWAEGAGVDERGINFVLKYPEMMVGKERTNPRSLTEFFYSLKNYSNLSDKLQCDECMLEAYSSLDEETVTVLMKFLTCDVENVISPELILNDPDEAERKARRMMDNNREDIIFLAMDRLTAHFLSSEYVFNPKHVESFERWILMEREDSTEKEKLYVVPRDLVYANLDNLANSRWKYVRQFISNPKLMDMVLNMYKKV